MSTARKSLWLIAEYCDAHFYMGWHLYLRETAEYQTRNADGGWGWIRHPREGRAAEFLADIGCPVTGDGTCDGAGIQQFAKRFPLPGKKVGRRKRGGLLITIHEETGIIRPAS